MITYQAVLDVPRELAWYVSRLLAAERRRRGTRKESRALTCSRRAVLGLRWLRSLRALAERGFALLAGRWRTLHHITASPGKIGNIAKAALVLTHFEHGRIT
jgi:hypothetical protein